LLLIHGLGARGEDWAALIPGLAAKGFHVYAPDLLGYGRSAKPDVDYSMRLEEQVTVEFMQAMHLDHADVGGWSMGGWVAMQLTLDHPERVDKLVIYDSAGIRFVPDFKQELFTPSDAAGLALLQAKLFPHPRVLPGFVIRDLLHKVQKARRVVGNSMADMMSGQELLDDRLSQMSGPMLIVWGEEDKLIPVSVGRDIHRLVPQSVMETVPGCGHMAPAECPQPVLADTLSFLKGPSR
jgi:pimeloyl-ACP methyl ester carboxylesterase